MPLVSLSEAARVTGVSRQQLYRLRDRGALKGWLHRDADGKPLIEITGLREHLCGWSRVRVDSFHFRKPEVAPSPAADDAVQWTPRQEQAFAELQERVSELLEVCLAQVVEAGADAALARQALEKLVPAVWLASAQWLVSADEEQADG